jgi:hypothetical protein
MALGVADDTVVHPVAKDQCAGGQPRLERVWHRRASPPHAFVAAVVVTSILVVHSGESSGPVLRVVLLLLLLLWRAHSVSRSFPSPVRFSWGLVLSSFLPTRVCVHCPGCAYESALDPFGVRRCDSRRLPTRGFVPAQPSPRRRWRRGARDGSARTYLSTAPLAATKLNHLSKGGADAHHRGSISRARARRPGIRGGECHPAFSSTSSPTTRRVRCSTLRDAAIEKLPVDERWITVPR